MPLAENEFGWRWSVAPNVVDKLNQRLVNLFETNGRANHLTPIALGALTGKLGASLMVQFHSGMLQRADYIGSDDETYRVLAGSRELLIPSVYESGTGAGH